MAQQPFQIIHRKKGMKNLIKKMIWMQAYYATSGIQKNEGRQWVKSSGGKGKIKLAKLAQVLETFATWIQPKTVVITGFDGEEITIPKGARLQRPARPFIMLYKVPEVWEKLRAFYKKLVLEHFRKLDRSYKQGAKKIIDEVGLECQKLQKDRILSLSTKGNSEITKKVKGFDFPLMDSGKMESSIRSKTISTASGKAQRDEAKLKYLTQIDELIKQLNGK